jgi:hypothetical protein
MNIDIQFFQGRSGLSGAFNRDHEVAALRKMGFTGTLSDMRQQFYYYVTGNPWLQDAKALSKGMTARTSNKSFTGKVKGDGDNTRLIYYGSNAAGFSNPTQFTNEASGYSSAAIKDGTLLYFETTSPNFVGFLFKYGLGSTKSDLQKNIKAISFVANTKNADVFVWNATKSLFVKINTAANAFTDLSSDVLGTIDECIDQNGTIQFLVQTTTKGDGVTARRLEIDFAQLNVDYFK